MIIKNKVLINLNRYNYKFIENNNQFTIYLDFSHQISIDFTNSDKIIIKDKLVHWNFLTGSIPMSLKNAMIYNFVGIIIFIGLSIFQVNNILPFFIGYIGWVLLFTIFYSIKYESFKQQVISWTID